VSQEKILVRPTRSKKLWWELFFSFFIIGGFTVGGGWAMLPLIEREIVEKKKWMDSENFMDLVAVAQSAPGVLAVNMAVSVGYQLAGVIGAVAATIGAVFFSFLIIILIAVFLTNFQDNQYIQSFFRGVAPAVTMLLLSAAINIGRKVIKDKAGIALVVIGLPCLIWLGVHPIWTIFGAGIFGALYYKHVL
jgi:chromate transporter